MSKKVMFFAEMSAWFSVLAVAVAIMYWLTPPSWIAQVVSLMLGFLVGVRGVYLFFEAFLYD